MSLAKAIKSIPGTRWALQKLTNYQNNSGDWLYQQRIVQWLYEPRLRSQLPFGHRIFARYCQFQKPFSSNYVVGGQTLLRTIIAANRIFGREDHLGLDLGNCKIFVNLRDPRMLQVTNEMLKHGPEAELVEHYLGESDTFLDVGANHGSFSVIAARRLGKGGCVIAIEPQPRMAELVKKSLEANARCRFEVHQFACGDKEGQVEFYIPKSTSGTAGLFPGFSATAAHEKLTVTLKKFDDAFDWRKFPGSLFLKLDVEGSELFFLRGAQEMVATRKPKILLEINPRSSQAAGVTVEQTLQFLRDAGYTSYVELELPPKPRPLSDLNAQRQRNVIILP